jgi:hypothetical protein
MIKHVWNRSSPSALLYESNRKRIPGLASSWDGDFLLQERLSLSQGWQQKNVDTLSFFIKFQHEEDRCYLAHCFPYTYTDLQQFLSRLESDCRIRKILRRKLLCHSLAGNRCDVLTITNPPARPSVCIGEASAPDMAAEKKCVVLSARVHPGETNAS